MDVKRLAWGIDQIMKHWNYTYDEARTEILKKHYDCEEVRYCPWMPPDQATLDIWWKENVKK